MIQKLVKLNNNHNQRHNHDKYIITPTPEFNKFTAEIFPASLALENSITKTDFDNKLISINKKFNSDKRKNKNQLKKLQTFDLT